MAVPTVKIPTLSASQSFFVSLTVFMIVLVILWFIFKNQLNKIGSAPSDIIQGAIGNVNYVTAQADAPKKTLSDKEIKEIAQGVLQQIYHGDYGNAGWGAMLQNWITDDDEQGATRNLMKMGSDGDVLALERQIEIISKNERNLYSMAADLGFDNVEKINADWASKGITKSL